MPLSASPGALGPPSASSEAGPGVQAWCSPPLPGRDSCGAVTQGSARRGRMSAPFPGHEESRSSIYRRCDCWPRRAGRKWPCCRPGRGGGRRGQALDAGRRTQRLRRLGHCRLAVTGPALPFQDGRGQDRPGQGARSPCRPGTEPKEAVGTPGAGPVLGLEGWGEGRWRRCPEAQLAS